MSEVSIRAATVNDEHILLSLEQKVVDAERPFNSAIKETGVVYYDIANLLASDNSLLLVAEADGHIVGTGYAQIRESKQSLVHDQHAYLGFMYVNSQHRGQAIIQKIIEALMSWAKQQGVYDFYLDVYSANAAAIRAYEKAGFTSSMLEMKHHGC